MMDNIILLKIQRSLLSCTTSGPFPDWAGADLIHEIDSLLFYVIRGAMLYFDGGDYYSIIRFFHGTFGVSSLKIRSIQQHGSSIVIVCYWSRNDMIIFLLPFGWPPNNLCSIIRVSSLIHSVQPKCLTTFFCFDRWLSSVSIRSCRCLTCKRANSSCRRSWACRNSSQLFGNSICLQQLIQIWFYPILLSCCCLSSA